MGLAEEIRQRIDAGILPRSAPVKVYAGHGEGQPCSACREPILKAQVQYEFELPDAGLFRFHVGCFGLWEAELMRRGLMMLPPR